MAFEQQIRDLIREELEAALGPLARDVAELQRNGDLTAQLRAALGGGAAARRPKAPKAGAKRKPGRPAAAASSRSTHACAVIGCKRPSRSKGYCAAHYQKQRMLTKTHRLPADWVDGAAPQSVKDIVLPRGRAGARALADARKK